MAVRRSHRARGDAHARMPQPARRPLARAAVQDDVARLRRIRRREAPGELLDAGGDLRGRPRVAAREHSRVDDAISGYAERRRPGSSSTTPNAPAGAAFENTHSPPAGQAESSRRSARPHSAGAPPSIRPASSSSRATQRACAPSTTHRTTGTSPSVCTCRSAPVARRLPDTDAREQREQQEAPRAPHVRKRRAPGVTFARGAAPSRHRSATVGPRNRVITAYHRAALQAPASPSCGSRQIVW